MIVGCEKIILRFNPKFVPVLIKLSLQELIEIHDTILKLAGYLLTTFSKNIKTKVMKWIIVCCSRIG